MSSTASFFTFAGVGMALLGVFGYLTERRKRGAPAARRLLLWYAFVVSVLACSLIGTVYPTVHWLLYLAGAAVAVGVLVGVTGVLRASSKAGDEHSSKPT